MAIKSIEDSRTAAWARFRLVRQADEAVRRALPERTAYGHAIEGVTRGFNLARSRRFIRGVRPLLGQAAARLHRERVVQAQALTG